MKFTAQQLAQVLNGTIEGDPGISVWKLAKIEEADEGSLTFLANPALTPYAYKSKASILVVTRDFEPEQSIAATMIRVDNPYNAFSTLLEMYSKIKLNKSGISSQAIISPTAKIGNNAYIGEMAYIGENVVIGDNVKIYPLCYVGDNVHIDDNSTLFPSVTIYSDNIIGKNCNLQAGVVIGADGYGYIPQEDKTYKKIPQTGNVILEDNVDIGANTTIDRAMLGSTIIRKGCKISNMVMIAHNVDVGENTILVAQVGIAGSTTIGKNCMIGGQAGLVQHLNIADGVKIQAQSGINGSINKENALVQGSPAFDLNEYRRSYVHFKNLSKHVARIDELEKELKALREKLQ